VFVIRQALELCGFEYQLDLAVDGAAAMDLIERPQGDPEARVPTLVLLDLNIPKIPGIDVLSALRRSERLAHVPVIVVTSSDSPEDLRAIQDAGATRYFRKPLELTAFMGLADVIVQVLAAG
jgi:CheY-like chemotaxis protein